MATPHSESGFSVSPSLLESITIRPVVSDNFRLTTFWRMNFHKMIHTNSSDEVDKQSQYSLHPPIASGSGHAHTGVLMQPHPQDLEPPPLKRFQTLSSEQLESLSKPSIPKTTTKWALDNFYSWMRHRNSTAKTATDKCPDPKMLNKWLSAYITETRKVTGNPYPPATLQSLFSGLLRHM